MPHHLSTRPRRSTRLAVAATVIAALAASASVAVGTIARAAAGCQVGYQVTAQWTGGFTAAVTIKNLGDPLTGWKLGWTFPAGQSITQAWGFTADPVSGTVVATNVDYNAAIGTGAVVEVGFNGSWTTGNPVPAAFTLNGTACTGGTAPTAAPTTAAPSPSATPSPKPSVSPSASPVKPTVAKDGTGTYTTVQAAINAVPSGNTTRRVITIKAGTYREQIKVPADKPLITLQGLGSAAAQTVIVYNRNAGSYGATGSATAWILGKNFAASNLTFSNDFDENSSDTGDQALAMYMDGDRAVFSNTRFLGDQDTLRVEDGNRAYFTGSYVEGTVDFIYSGGTAVFSGCQIYEKRSSGGPITAASTPTGQNYGFLFYRSTVTGAAGNVTQLGRPWQQGAQVVFRESDLSATIRTAQPWADMGDAAWKQARFFEYRNTGAGATVNSNRPQLTDAQAANYTPQKYLAGTDGWNPVT
ncbi:pectinesterase family protein [Catellatospora sp. KI3]|uniref:pectinesterase family protein n=1 Tax=Catellatospora sp. KI3 TaxID=3041620 RepID=UPI002482255B|nr:pectinesterase family protein [Catellatospora sp. KI3]MDI1465384.1 pectinesterase family protein [Catellatospora sp. KI3]